ncbi:MAG: Rrf2 family transcriptional regulator [Planctomycetes bacterium]|nr:Rrf2 family transcriptional regulator [Planctomycetota bacterium]
MKPMSSRKKKATLAHTETLREEAKAHEVAIERARLNVRRAAMVCQRFGLGRAAVWAAPKRGQSIGEWMGSPVQRERRNQLSPFNKDHNWPKANHLYSAEWIERWGVLAGAIRELDGLERGTLDFVLELEPETPRNEAMHDIFCKLLRGYSQRRLAGVLAALRSNLVPTRAEVQRRRGWMSSARFELAQYFDWILRSFSSRWSPPRTSCAESSRPTDAQAGVLEILRRQKAAGRGVTAKELAKELHRSEDRVRRIISELRVRKFSISNRGGGNGYLLEAEP